MVLLVKLILPDGFLFFYSFVTLVAVPTSTGYGANLGGIAPLLTMLNSCAMGVSVVNIDNSLSAGYLAARIVRQIHDAGAEARA